MDKSFSITVSSVYFFSVIASLPADSGLRKELDLSREAFEDRDLSGNFSITGEYSDGCLDWNIEFDECGSDQEFCTSGYSGAYTAEFGKFLRSFSKDKVLSYKIE
jgi:hypothetical protein